MSYAEKGNRCMTIWYRTRLRFAICAGVVALAGCGGGVPDSTATAAHQQLEPSWMSADANSKTLLYVSDWATNAVFVYDYSTRTLVGRLAGFKTPYGQCTDAQRHVWIAEFGGADVVEYAHGGTTPVKRLRTDGHPIGCSVDPATGNLAVANFYTSRGSGTIQIWKDAAGTPRTYWPKTLYYLWPPAYDENGDLVVEGQVFHGRYGVAELRASASELHEIALKGARIQYAGAALWDGEHIGLTDQNSDGQSTTVIYRVSIVRFTATVFNRTHLTDRCNGKDADVVQPFIFHTALGAELVIGGNLSCSGRFDYWKYPDGGDPHASLRDAPEKPFGQSVSPAAQDVPIRHANT